MQITRNIARIQLVRSKERKATRPELATEIWVTASGGITEDMLRKEMDAGTFVSTMRLGDRTATTFDEKGGYAVGHSVLLRIQRSDGTFAPDDRVITITRTDMRALRDISDEDVAQTRFTGTTKREFVERFSAIYKRPISEDETITIVSFMYGEPYEIC
jgi:hypothetical protein